MTPLFESLCDPLHLQRAWEFVLQKKAVPGVDKVTWQDYAAAAEENLKALSVSLKEQKWKPEPYLMAMIPKKDSSFREIGLMSIEDKVVQQAIKLLVEPIFEKHFYASSYAYRPGRGHMRAVRRTFHECRTPRNKWVLKLDIDNYFDNIDHEILFSRLKNIIRDAELCRLIELCVKMGRVNNSYQWQDKVIGIPQGSILSPLLANLYATSFDQFVGGLTSAYVRYADDFVVFCEDEGLANDFLERIKSHLKKKLKLDLNVPQLGLVSDGFEFLGIRFNDKCISLSEVKKKEIFQKINSIEVVDNNLSKKYRESLAGIERYYVSVLPMEYTIEFTDALCDSLRDWLRNNPLTPYKKFCSIFSDLPLLGLIDRNYKKTLRDVYKAVKDVDPMTDAQRKALNKKLIHERKLEYIKRESDNSELVIASYGYYIGAGGRGITLHKKGTQVPTPPSGALKHITILSEGVSISTNAIRYCMERGIPIDLFDNHNKHIGTIMSPKYQLMTLWDKQSMFPVESRMHVAKKIIEGKLRNQLNLMKYFNKYHKDMSSVRQAFDIAKEKIEEQLLNLKGINQYENYKNEVMSCEAQGALSYWNFIKALLADDEVGFEYREQRGAVDLVNSMLNFGYSLLYPRIWQAILRHKLNPYLGLVHYQEGNPNLVFDFIELFRQQAVDRVVISMIQKHERLKLKDDGWLDDSAKALLAQNVFERFHRYEKYRGKDARFIDIIDAQIKEFIDYMVEGKTYRPYIAKW